MRILRQFLIPIIVLLMLQGCASSRMAEELQSGKISFEDGNFKSAFHKLLPLASDGNAAAEYAVGYMYYYGYGTTQDNDSGLFWMRKSAEQRYEPAIKALHLIEQNKPSPEPTQQLTAEQSVKTESDQIVQALADNALDQTASSAPPADNLADFNIEHKKKFTLQLMGSANLADIKRTQSHLHIEESSYCARTERKGRDWYIWFV